MEFEDEIEEKDADLDEWDRFKKTVKKFSNKNPKYASPLKEQKKKRKKAEFIEMHKKEIHEKWQTVSAKKYENYIEIDNLDGVDKNLYKDVIAGKVKPEHQLDLHGYRNIEASNAIIEFVSKCYYGSARLILIITGKGEKDNPNTLRSNLSKNLNSQSIKSMILFVAKAASKHGGSGAFYVFLRKNKNR